MNYTVTEPHPTRDRNAILDLWRANLPMATGDRYAWLYETGPGKNWLAADDSGAAIGSTGLMLRNFCLSGRQVRVGQAIDLNVVPEHRSVGPALKLQRSLIDSTRTDGIPLVYAVPSKNADPIMRRIGYKVVGKIGRWVKPLRSEYKLREKLPLGPFVRPASFIVDQALRLKSAERGYRRAAAIEVEIAPRFDERFDRLWSRAAPQFQIAGERTSDYLNWRYGSCPDVKYRTFCLTDGNRELKGYVVYCEDSEGFAAISDFLFSSEQSFEILLAEFLQHLRIERKKAASLFYFGTSRVTATLRRFGFCERHTERQLYVFVDRHCDPAELPRLMDRESWFFTKADSDTDI